MTQINNLKDIVKNGLCIGCGLCQSISGKDYIEISMSPKGRLEPKEIQEISSETFNKILNVCPGVIVEGLPKEQVDLVMNLYATGKINEAIDAIKALNEFLEREK